MVRVPKATEVEWILSLNEEENELVRSEFYYEQVITIKCNGHLSFFMMSDSITGNTEVDSYSLVLACLLYNYMSAKTSKPVRQKRRTILRNVQEETRKKGKCVAREVWRLRWKGGVEDRGKTEHRTDLCGDWGDGSAGGKALSVQA